MQPLRLSCAQGWRAPDSTGTLAAGAAGAVGAGVAAWACTDARGNTLPNNAVLFGGGRLGLGSGLPPPNPNPNP